MSSLPSPDPATDSAAPPADPLWGSPARDIDPEETALGADPRLQQAIALFNQGEWYGCHDGFEELWHETQGPLRPLLQGVLQVAVARLHLERGNHRGATVLLGEGLGRLQRCGPRDLDLDVDALRRDLRPWLAALQNGGSLEGLPPLRLIRLG